MNLQTLKTKIPHGGYREIARESCVHVVTISNFFNGKVAVTPITENKILSATAKYLKALKRETEKTTNQLKGI